MLPVPHTAGLQLHTVYWQDMLPCTHAACMGRLLQAAAPSRCWLGACRSPWACCGRPCSPLILSPASPGGGWGLQLTETAAVSCLYWTLTAGQCKAACWQHLHCLSNFLTVLCCLITDSACLNEQPAGSTCAPCMVRLTAWPGYTRVFLHIMTRFEHDASSCCAALACLPFICDGVNTLPTFSQLALPETWKL